MEIVVGVLEFCFYQEMIILLPMANHLEWNSSYPKQQNCKKIWNNRGILEEASDLVSLVWSSKSNDESGFCNLHFNLALFFHLSLY